MTSLSEKISNLTNPAPAVLDPEDAVNDESSASVRKFYESNNDVVFTSSELRSKAAVLLDDSDPAYTGKKVSRKSLDKVFFKESDDDDDDGDLDSEDEEKSEDGGDLEAFKQSLVQQMSSDEGDGQSEESIESEESEDEEITETTDDMVNQFSHFDVTSEIEKATAVKNQLEIINRLCEARIRLQKPLAFSHTFPQKDCWNAVKNSGGKEMADVMHKVSAAAETTLNSLLDFQLEYFNRINNKHKKEKISDEEIPSDTDEEVEENKPAVKKQQKSMKLSKRKLKSHEYSNLLSEHLKMLLPYRNSVLQTWDEKTKLSTGRITQKSFSAFESSVVKQIEQILQDKDRLIKRTQLKRSQYRIIGKPDESEVKIEDDAESNEHRSKQDMQLKDYDPEIYDDDDFYRQFLRDVIESKSVGIDPVSLRKQMDIQNVRSKIKRKVDTKASKGRKIRFDVDPKIAGFAIAENIPTDAARDSILKSLCGGYQTISS